MMESARSAQIEELRETARQFTLSAMRRTGWSRRWRLALANIFSCGVDIGREIEEIERHDR